MESMNDLANTSNLLTIKKIGQSYLKNNDGRISNQFDIPTDGHDIYAYVITDPSISPSKKGKALYTSGMHAREYGKLLQCSFFAIAHNTRLVLTYLFIYAA